MNRTSNDEEQGYSMDKTSFCFDMYLSFDFHNNFKFSYIFDMNYDTIKTISIPTLCVFICYLFLYIIMKIDECNIERIKSSCNFCICLYSNKNILKIIKIVLWAGKSLLYYFLWYNIESGDIGKYEDFLKCKYVNKEYFDETFPDTHKLRRYYIILIFFNLFTDLLDKFENVLKSAEEGIELDSNPEQTNKVQNTELSENRNEIKINTDSEIMAQIPKKEDNNNH